jgi:uncharacterized protein with ParB-like and HNH nuclease domain
MERNTLEKFFTGKFFVVPSYQRDYAWTTENIDDLLNDIEESIETGTSHYIGTFILSRTATDDAYNIVDGQQRLTTLTMILNAAIKLLSTDQQLIYKNMFLRDVAKKRWRLRLADYNAAFFTALLADSQTEAQSKSQRLLKDAYVYIADRIKSTYDDDPDQFDYYLDSLKQLEVMEFIESDEGKAIRIFQTVNSNSRRVLASLEQLQRRGRFS